MDGVVIVIRADSTRREVVERALAMVREAKGPVVGAVLADRKRRIPWLIYRRM
jgi:Mrp family chromosome partitioning ATPase